MEKAKALLKNIFGYDTFRPLQHEIIQNVLGRKDALVIMPTGGGKSICYQIPALIFEGLTVVISPLISLMKDQVVQLRQLGVNAALLNSSLTSSEYNKNYVSVMDKKAKLLYLAPESVVKEDISNLLKNVNVDCITVDEAHCISEWGHDFRPEYRLLGELREKFPNAVCIALTATATPRVQDDIMRNLHLHKGEKYLASFNRENLFLQVVPKTNSFMQVISFLEGHKDQSGIIYCFSRKQVDTLSEDLLDRGYSVRPYHAGLSDQERNENQDLFIKDEIQIIVATIAFGMGINKSNVRFVIHHDLPKNIESYYQEIGRSGRDGVKADCVLLYSYADVSKINYFIDQKENPTEQRSARLHLDAIVKYAESDSCRRHTLINYFGENYTTENCGFCDNCLTDVKDLTDVTIAAQKFLSTVKRTGEIFGAAYIIDVLCGSESDKIFSNNHQILSVYAIGKEYTKKQWHSLANQFISKGLVERTPEYGSLKLTEKAIGVLLRKEKVYGIVKETVEITVKPKTDELLYDHELFELLRKKRKQIADDNDLPPFVVFSDKTLIQMAANYPQNENQLLDIGGVGISKLEKYGNAFLSVIKSYCLRNNIQIKINGKLKPKNTKPVQTPRHITVGEAFNSGKYIEELANEYNVQPQTITNHLFRYQREGYQLNRTMLEKNISIDQKIIDRVFEAYRQEGTASLGVVFEVLNKEIPYEDLHLIRLLFLSK